MSNTYTHLTASTPAASEDRFLNETAMKNGAYTLDETTLTTQGMRRITITHSSANDYYDYPVDDLGTVTLVGKDAAGNTVTEVVTVVADDTATTVRFFATLTSATGAGWVQSGDPDTITIGYAGDIAVIDGNGHLFAVVVNTTAAGTIVLADAKGTIATLKSEIAEGHYEYDLDISGFLTVDLNANSDVTVIHSAGLPTQYALS